MTQASYTVFVSVGEESADLHTSKVCAELRRMLPGIRLLGFGGEKMREAGVEILYPLPDLALIGFVEVAKHLPQIFRLRRQALDVWQRERPDAVLLVDYPGFHLRLAREAHERGIPVLYFISPQVWAWKENRVELMRRVIDRLFVIFPFEVPFFERHEIQAQYVGHPLIERIQPRNLNEGQIEEKVNHPVIGIMPGSRRSELRHILPPMLQAARALKARHSHWRFLLPLADPLPEAFLQRFDVPDFVEVRRDHNYQRRCEMTLAWTASGTATVENALLGIPMVVVYRSGPVNAFLGRRLVRVPYIGMVNLIAQKGICQEFIQEQFQPRALIRWTEELLLDPPRYREMLEDLARLRGKMGHESASRRAAQGMADFLQTLRPAADSKPALTG